MRIDVWSDVVCPWCSIGRKRLEHAIAGFEHGDEVEVVYHSYQLDPAAPTEAHETAQQMLERKYRLSPADALQAQAKVRMLAAEEGMHWRNDDSPHVNTGDAHRLLHLALAAGGPAMQTAFKTALHDAYFGEARNVADPVVLTELALGVGMDADRVAAVLGSEEFADAVETDIRQAAAYGATGVPFFVVDQRFGISGAQPTELFTQTLERAWAAAGSPTE